MAMHDKALLALVTPTHVGRSHLTLRICTLVPSKKTTGIANRGTQLLVTQYFTFSPTNKDRNKYLFTF